MSETAKNNIIAFPVNESHRVDTGGVPSMEIKHTHPIHASAEKRAESLKDKYRVCLSQIATARSKETSLARKGA